MNRSAPPPAKPPAASSPRPPRPPRAPLRLPRPPPGALRAALGGAPPLRAAALAALAVVALALLVPPAPRGGGDAWPPRGGGLRVYAGARGASALRAARVCGGFASVKARYVRRSVTPTLVVYERPRGGGAAPAPCAVLKLSCRLRASPGGGHAITVRHAGAGRDQAAYVDTAWGDALSQAALAALADAAADAGAAGGAAAAGAAAAAAELRAAAVPAGGVFVGGLDQLNGSWARRAERRAARRAPDPLPLPPQPVPAACVFPGGHLLGFGAAFVPRLRQQPPSPSALAAQGPAGRAALAIMWLLDAVTGSADRGYVAGKNMFAARGSRDYVPLDFGDWRLDAASCAAGDPGRPARALARVAHFWRPLVLAGARSACGDAGAAAAARGALRLAAAACGAADGGAAAFDFGRGGDATCAGFRARLAQRLREDPWFAAQAASPAAFADGAQCCEFDGGAPVAGRPVVSRCGECCADAPDPAARAVCAALQRNVGAACFAAARFPAPAANGTSVEGGAAPAAPAGDPAAGAAPPPPPLPPQPANATSVVAFLAALTTARLRDVGASLQEMLAECPDGGGP